MHRFLLRRLLLQVLFLVAFVFLNFFLVGRMIYKEYKLEKGFRTAYGADWKEQYDKRFGGGSLERAGQRTTAGYVGMPVITLLLALLYRQATMDRSGGSERPHRPKIYRQKNKW